MEPTKTELTRRTLADQLADQLGRDIAFRRLAPGERLREVDLATRYSVSRPLVREVLRRLEDMGLAESAAWRGSSVPILTAEELGDLHDFAGQTFAFTARLAARRANPDRLVFIDRSVSRLEQIAADPGGDAESYEDARTAARQAVERASGPIYKLAHRRSMLRGLGHQFSHDNVRTVEQRALSARRWRRLCALITAGDAEEAYDQAIAMYADTRAAVLEAHADVMAALDVKANDS
jgi:DNA-binding GntR family transcriptional regulator